MRADILLHPDAAASQAPPYHTPPHPVKPRTGSVMSQFYLSRAASPLWQDDPNENNRTTEGLPKANRLVKDPRPKIVTDRPPLTGTSPAATAVHP